MSVKIIDGKKIAESITNDVKKEIKTLGYTPGLAVFLIGDDEASKLYVKLKEKACQEVGIDFHQYLCDDITCEADILNAIHFLNEDKNIHAILVQLPLPDGFDEQKVIDRLNPEKDVDGFHPQSLKSYLSGKDDFVPGLSRGIIKLIENTKELIKGKQAVILANSDVFSKPLVKLLEEQGASAIVASPDDQDLKDHTRNADILIVAIGREAFVKADMIKEGSILIDVGTTKVGNRVKGDIDFEDIKDKAGFITPVPGGVGPITVAMLLENTVRLAKRQQT